MLFPLSCFTNLVASTAFVYVLVGLAHINAAVAPLTAAAATIPVTFLVSRLVLVGRPAKQHGYAR